MKSIGYKYLLRLPPSKVVLRKITSRRSYVPLTTVRFVIPLNLRWEEFQGPELFLGYSAEPVIGRSAEIQLTSGACGLENSSASKDYFWIEKSMAALLRKIEGLLNETINAVG